jgi:predicted ribosome quality control (RQC) complex YloA/Tae2 family protein
MRSHVVKISNGLNVVFDVGQNAQENHDLIDIAKPHDIWVHVKGRPSCHVIGHIPVEVIESASKVRRDTVRKIAKQGAVLCKRYSKYASEKHLAMDICRVSGIEKTSTRGEVVITNPELLNVIVI